jgi:signal transduction histidine kinase/DNA-binding response OmpR family regulator/HPt (histidine-containing phosphotransfer) domain-containing protein
VTPTHRARLLRRMTALVLGLVAIAVVVPALPAALAQDRLLRERMFAAARSEAALVALTSSDLFVNEKLDRMRELAATVRHDLADVAETSFTSRAGIVLADSDRDREGMRIAELATPPAALQERVRATPDGPRLVVDAPVKVGGEPFGTFRLELSLHALEAATRAALLRGAAIGLLLLGASAAVAYLLARSIARPVERLAAAALEVARGVPGVRTGIRRDDEIGLLAASFDGMARGIESSRAELADHSRNLEQRVRERTDELRLARDAALAAVRAKSEFLANMSHEIRTPMNGVLGFVELLGSTPLEERQREYLNTVRASGEALLSILNDILDFSKIEAGRIELETIDFSPRELVESVADLFAPKAQEKKIEFMCGVAASVPPRLKGDPTRLRQVLLNLVGNAIKFTEHGEVELETTATERPDGQSALEFVVRDTGIGIARSRIGGLFQPFVQADGSTTRKFGGTGLGLVISRRLVDLMGGTIEVASEEQKGTRFTVRVVLPSGTPVAAAPIVPVALHQAPVLVVDDNATNRSLMHEVLRSFGCEVVCVAGGSEALAALRDAADAGRRFGLLLIDMQMPDMDGRTFAELVRADARFADIPRILLSSMLFASTVRASELGVHAILTKPVKRAALFDAIVTVFDQLSGGEVESAPVPPTDKGKSPSDVLVGVGKGIRLLLAEDNPVNQKLAKALLGKTGAEVLLADTGRAAVETWERGGIDMILMDVQMPEMDGTEATVEIRRREGPDRHVPIVAMTAHAMPGDREMCLGAGMDDYITKPIRPAELARVVGQWGRGRQGEAAEPAPRPAGEDELMSDAKKYADVVERLREIGLTDDPELLAETTQLFLNDAAAMVESMKDGFSKGDAGALGRAAHRLKGAALNLGVASVAGTARSIEEKARRSELVDVASAVAVIENELKCVGDFLHGLAKTGASR